MIIFADMIILNQLWYLAYELLHLEIWPPTLEFSWILTITLDILLIKQQWKSGSLGIQRLSSHLIRELIASAVSTLYCLGWRDSN